MADDTIDLRRIPERPLDVVEGAPPVYVPPAPMPVEHFKSWMDDQGNFVTPELVAYENQAWQAEVSAYERMTGEQAFPALGIDVDPDAVIAPSEPAPTLIDEAYPRPPDPDAVPVLPAGWAD